jgi:dTMP kinase
VANSVPTALDSPPARFVTFEGLDGSGKTTQLRRASAWLDELGVAHTATLEPGGTPLGERVRALFLDAQLRPSDGVVEALLVFASRRQHLHDVIEPALARGEHVLCDRFTDSTLVYQGAGRGLDERQILAIDAIATGGRRPDLTLVFDVDCEIADRRRAGERRGRDRFDEESRAFQARVRQAYLDLAESDPGRVRLIDAAADVETTAAAVRAALRAAGIAMGATRARS